MLPKKRNFPTVSSYSPSRTTYLSGEVITFHLEKLIFCLLLINISQRLRVIVTESVQAILVDDSLKTIQLYQFNLTVVIRISHPTNKLIYLLDVKSTAPSRTLRVNRIVPKMKTFLKQQGQFYFVHCFVPKMEALIRKISYNLPNARTLQPSREHIANVCDVTQRVLRHYSA